MEPIIETPEELLEEVAPEVVEERELVCCPRCGKEVYADEVEGDDHCSDCEDWFFCEKCEEWLCPDDGENHVEGEDGIWCDSCVEHHAYTCERCGKIHTDSLTTVATRSGRRATEEWCDDCVSSHSWRCVECEEHFSTDCDSWNTDDGDVCQGCHEDGYGYCENCECSHRDGTCPESRRLIAGYGCHGDFNIRNTTADKMAIIFGAEMEIYTFHRSSNRDEMVTDFMDDGNGLGHEFAYPTEDGSLSSTGVEFISHPQSVLDWMQDERLDLFMGLLNDYDASTRRNSGCHLTCDRDIFKSDTALDAAIAVVSRFRDALMWYSEDKSRGDSYCRKINFEECATPSQSSLVMGKMACVNIKRNESLVEFRTPGMVLNSDDFRVQIQLYSNVIAWANTVNSWQEALTANWKDIFLPVVGSCLGFAELAERTPTITVEEYTGYFQIEHDGSQPIIVVQEAIQAVWLRHGSDEWDCDVIKAVEGGIVEAGDIIYDESLDSVFIALSGATGFTGTVHRWVDRVRFTSNYIHGASIYTQKRDGRRSMEISIGDTRHSFGFHNVPTPVDPAPVCRFTPPPPLVVDASIDGNEWNNGMLNARISLSIDFDSRLFRKHCGLGALQESPIRICDSGYIPYFNRGPLTGVSQGVGIRIYQEGKDGMVSFSYSGRTAVFRYKGMWGK